MGRPAPAHFSPLTRLARHHRVLASTCSPARPVQSLTSPASTPLAPLPLHLFNARRRFYSPSASPPAPTGTWRSALLPSRALIGLDGPDALTFLQGLVTQDVARIGAEGVGARAGAFLQPNGRLLYDCVVYVPGGGVGGGGTTTATVTAAATAAGPEVWVEHDAGGTAALWKHLARFVLRSKVRLRLGKQLRVWAVWNDGILPSRERGNTGADAGASTDGHRSAETNGVGAQEHEWDDGGWGEEAREAGVIKWKDGRVKGMGYRVLVASQFGQEALPGTVPSTALAYELHSILLGVPPSLTPAYPVTLPLEANLDLYPGSVDFRKGCYVGQELTARTHYKGVVRKRLVPVCLWRAKDPSSAPPLLLDGLGGGVDPGEGLTSMLPGPGSELKPLASLVSKPRPTGKLAGPMAWAVPRGGEGEPVAVGLGVMRLESMDREGGGVMKAGEVDEEGKQWWVQGYKPDWWPRDLLY